MYPVDKVRPHNAECCACDEHPSTVTLTSQSKLGHLERRNFEYEFRFKNLNLVSYSNTVSNRIYELSRNTNKMKLCNRIYYSKVF
jgi:hypothetical protein